MRNINTIVENVITIVRQTNYKELKEVLKEYLEDDYIPRNIREFCPAQKYGLEDIINIQRYPKLDSGVRCATIIDEDIQSGFIYCGDDCCIIAESKNEPGVFYALCIKHALRHGII